MVILPKNPYSKWFPDESKYCNKQDIDLLHQEIYKILGIYDIYPDLTWCFEPRFRSIFGQAEYWTDDNDSNKKYWKIRYSSKYWILMGEANRRNIIAHEVCHLAVEKLYGHCSNPESGKERVLDHGSHWKNLMIKCGENPENLILLD